MPQKDLLAVRVDKEFIPLFERACNKLRLKRPDCHRLALEMFVRIVDQEAVEEEGKVVVNIQSLTIQPHSSIEIGEEAINKLLSILKAVSHPATNYPKEWKKWAPVLINEIEKLKKGLSQNIRYIL